MTFRFKMLASARSQGKTEAVRRVQDDFAPGWRVGDFIAVDINRVGTYTCAMCNNTYGKDILLDREAENMIHKANFGESLTEDAKEVCEECYEKAKEIYKQKVGIK